MTGKDYLNTITEKPFATPAEQFEAWANFTDLLCRLLSGELSGNYPSLKKRVGYTFSGNEAVEILQEPEDDFENTVYSRELSEAFYRLIGKGLDADKNPVYPLSKVLNADLSNLERLGVIVAFTSLKNRKYENVFSYISDDKTGAEGCPTVGLINDMARFFVPEDELLEERAFSFLPGSFSVRFIFKEQDDLYKKDGMARSLVLKDSVKSYLDIGFPILCELSPYAYIMPEIEDVKKEKICLKETYEDIKKVLLNSRVTELSGGEGYGKRYLLSCAAAEYEKTVIVLDMKLFSEVEGEERFNTCIDELIFMSATCDCIPYLWCRGNVAAFSKRLRETFKRLYDEVPNICLGTEKHIPEDILGGYSDAVFRISVPETTSHDQEVLWLEAARQNGLTFPKDYNLNVLVSKFVMNPGRIFEVVNNTAAVIGKSKKKVEIGEGVLEDQIRRSCAVQFGENATRLTSFFTWGDLMISKESEELLRMAADRVRFRATVNEDFGFSRKLPYGRGVSIVLYGPPGTGKTMAAQVLANELGLDIYRIDLSQVSSKYIGETEKNLGAVFDAAKNSNAILFFDEADSLFSKRTSVSSSNDKYANAETSYLLQKIEEYTGVSVLATNNMQNFDAAFKRRMTFMISLKNPEEETRIRLWEAVFPEDTPIDDEIDFRILARVCEFTGSAIKSAAVTAAYRAASKGRAIKWDDLFFAIDIEGGKTGTLGLSNKLREAVITGID